MYSGSNQNRLLKQKQDNVSRNIMSPIGVCTKRLTPFYFRREATTHDDNPQKRQHVRDDAAEKEQRKKRKKRHIEVSKLAYRQKAEWEDFQAGQQDAAETLERLARGEKEPIDEEVPFGPRDHDAEAEQAAFQDAYDERCEQMEELVRRQYDLEESDPGSQESVLFFIACLMYIYFQRIWIQNG
jgi:hypothetical protein